jgi:hypothetical protein
MTVRHNDVALVVQGLDGCLGFYLFLIGYQRPACRMASCLPGKVQGGPICCMPVPLLSPVRL